MRHHNDAKGKRTVRTARSLIESMPHPCLLLLGVVPVTFFGVGWSVVRVALAVLLVYVCLAWFTRSDRATLRPAHLVAAAFVLVVGASAVFPAQVAVPLRRYELTTLVAGVAVLSVCASIRISVFGLCAAIAVGGAAVAAASLISATAFPKIGNAHPVLGRYELGRLVGWDLNSNGLGAMLALSLVAAVGLAWRSRQPWWLLAGIPCAVAMSATASRGAAVAAACGLAYLVVGQRRWWWRAAGIATAAVLGLGIAQAGYGDRAPEPVAQAAETRQSADENVAVALGPEQVSQGGEPAQQSPSNNGAGRTDEDFAFSNEVRIRAASLALEVAAHHPVRGIGYGGFAQYVESIEAFGIHMNTHNDFLRYAAESGLLAPALLVALVFLGMWRQRGNAAAISLRAIVVAHVATLMLSNFLSNLAISIAFWAALGVLLGHSPSGRTGVSSPAAHG